ncbi:MAG: DUF4340 domain-containing protein [Bacteroidetes bacterium]|nr:DUF4340 domain-containing protein [Bacteroidota bacterium]
MKSNKILFYTLTLVLLIIIGFLVYRSYLSVSGTFDVGSRLGVEPDKLTAIELQTQSEKIVFEKKDSIWMIISPFSEAADQEKMKDIIGLITESVMVAPISDNPEKQHIFGVDSTGKRLILTTGNDRVTYFVGNPGPDFSSVYIRQDGQNDVVIFSGNLGTLFTPAGDFRDRSLLRLQSDSISKVEIISTSENFVMLKDSTQWLIEGTIIEAEKVTPFESSLNRLDADYIADSLSAKSMNYPQSLLVSVTAGKQKHELKFYKIPERMEYAVTRSGSEKVYLISDWKVDRLNKSKAYWTGTQK